VLVVIAAAKVKMRHLIVPVKRKVPHLDSIYALSGIGIMAVILNPLKLLIPNMYNSLIMA